MARVLETGAKIFFAAFPGRSLKSARLDQEVRSPTLGAIVSSSEMDVDRVSRKR